jgi:hypothetical protein
MLKVTFTKANVPLFLLAGLSVRIVTPNAGFPEAIAMLGMSALWGWKLFLDHKLREVDAKKEEPINEKVKAELAELKTQISSVGGALQMTKTTPKLRF